MSTILDLLILPGSKLLAILAILFRAVRPVLRPVLTLPGPQKTSFPSLSQRPEYEYASPLLDAPSATRGIGETTSSVRVLTIRAGPTTEIEIDSVPLPVLGIILLLGSIVFLTSILVTLTNFCCKETRDDGDISLIADLYTNITGRPYAGTAWERVLVYQASSLASPPACTKYDFFFVRPDIWREALIADGSLSSEAGSPEFSSAFTHVIDDKFIDEYLQALTDAGYCEFQSRILDLNDLNPKNIVIEWEFSAKTLSQEIFMDATIRCLPVSAVPSGRRDYVLWDMGRGTFKALRVLDIVFTTKTRTDEHEHEHEHDGDVLGETSAVRGIDVDTDSDWSSEFSLGPHLSNDPFDSPGEITTDSDGWDDLPGNDSLDSDEVQDMFFPIQRMKGPSNRVAPNPRPFSLTSTPRTSVSKST